MDEKFRKKVYSFSKRLCGKWGEPFSFRHTLFVRAAALKMAAKEGADREVVEVAALLHDVGKFIDLENHEKESAKIAKRFLKTTKFSKKQQRMIVKSILEHRSASQGKSDLLESRILSAADGIAFLKDRVMQGLYLKMSNDPSKLKRKMRNMFVKITVPSGKESARKAFQKSIKYWKGKFRKF